MALEPQSFVTLIQDVDAHNHALFMALTARNEDLQKTINKMKTDKRKQKTLQMKTMLHARRQKHLQKNKDKTIKDMMDHTNNLKEENKHLTKDCDTLNYYIKNHGCMECSGNYHCTTCGY